MSIPVKFLELWANPAVASQPPVARSCAFWWCRRAVSGGQILLDGVGDLVPMKERELSKIRGSDVAFIFQDPLTALNPTMRVGKQISEVIRRHRNVSKRQPAKQRCNCCGMSM